MTITAIVHTDSNGLIGLNDHLAYSTNEDFKEFRRITICGSNPLLIMGKNTARECGLLVGRSILALSSNGNTLENQPTALTPELAIASNVDSDIFICGGTQVYKKYLPYCHQLIIHWTKSPAIVPKPEDKATYFDFAPVAKYRFRPIMNRQFKTFTQIVYQRVKPYL
jgi:dihydrofolate reductase